MKSLLISMILCAGLLAGCDSEEPAAPTPPAPTTPKPAPQAEPLSIDDPLAAVKPA